MCCETCANSMPLLATCTPSSSLRPQQWPFVKPAASWKGSIRYVLLCVAVTLFSLDSSSSRAQQWPFVKPAASWNGSIRYVLLCVAVTLILFGQQQLTCTAVAIREARSLLERFNTVCITVRCCNIILFGQQQLTFTAVAIREARSLLERFNTVCITVRCWNINPLWTAAAYVHSSGHS